MNPNEPIRYIQRGGVDNKRDSDLKAIEKALKKGYIKNTLPVEMQIYLREKLKLTTRMQGGSAWSNLASQFGGNDDNDDDNDDDEDKFIDYQDPEDDYQLPAGWTREVIDTAEEEAFFREDPDGETLQLVVPMTPAEKDALENAAFVDVDE